MPSVWGEYSARKRQRTEPSHEHQVVVVSWPIQGNISNSGNVIHICLEAT